MNPWVRKLRRSLLPRQSTHQTSQHGGRPWGNSKLRIEGLPLFISLLLFYVFSAYSINVYTLKCANVSEHFVKQCRFRPVKTFVRSLRRFGLLFGRASRQVLRDMTTNFARICVSSVLALVVGSVYGAKKSSNTGEVVWPYLMRKLDTMSISSRSHLLCCQGRNPSFQ